MTNPMLDVPYINDLLHQPQALQDTLSAFAGAELVEISSFAARLLARKPPHILLTGMGSSFHACIRCS